MSGIKLANGTAASAEMTVDTNGDAHVNLQADSSLAGFANVACELDAGTVTGERHIMIPEITEDYRLRVGVDTPLFSDWFPGTVLNSSVWTSIVSTHATAVAGYYATLNSGLSTAAGHAHIASYRSFPVLGSAGLTWRCRLQFGQTAQANNVCEWGLFIAATTAAPTAGVFFRLDAAGLLTCVLHDGVTETSSSTLSFATLIGAGTTREFMIDVSDHGAHFWIDDVLVADLLDSGGIGSAPWINCPIRFRLYNTGVTAAAQTMKVSFVAVTQADVDVGQSMPEMAAQLGNSGAALPTGSANLLQTCQWTNSSAPTAFVPSNTAINAAGTGLGGVANETATLAAATDGILFGYQVPAGTAALPGRSLVIRGVYIQSAVSTALTAGGFAKHYALAYGSTAATLATAADTAVVKAPRRIPLGTQGVVATAAAGTELSPVSRDFTTPVIVAPGEYVEVITRHTGTVASAGVISHTVSFDAYWL